MSKVVSLRGEVADLDARCRAVAKLFEEMAERARSGEVTAASVAFVRMDGTIGTLWEAAGQVYQTIGATSVLLGEMSGYRQEPE